MNPILAIPPAPTLESAGLNYTTAWNTWVRESLMPAFSAYFERYRARMAERGISVSVTDSQMDTQIYTVPPYVSGTLTKNGIVTEFGVTVGRAQQMDPEALADYDYTWSWEFGARVSGSPSSTWTPAPTVPVSTTSQSPGPATTVPSGGASSQPDQSPATPNVGTISTPPASAPAELHNWDEWNWFYEQETGRSGFDPSDAGVTDRYALMTYADWWAKAGPLYTAAPSSSGGTGSAGGDTGATAGGGATASVSVSGSTLAVLAAVAVAAFLALRK